MTGRPRLLGIVGSKANPHMMPCRFWSGIMKFSALPSTWPRLGAALALSLFALQPASSAERVGVAAAVKPEATSQPPGGDTSTLRIGKAVVYDERINTSGAGVVQVLLLDGSTFTVGPGSSLVIDKFVYNPSTGRGELVASFSKGALRFVGSKLSKNEPGVKVKTPAGALTVRGGIALIAVDGPNRAAAALAFGTYLGLVRGASATWSSPATCSSFRDGDRLLSGRALRPT
jgi:hypothetical protein